MRPLPGPFVAASATNDDLRVRLFIDAKVARLQGLKWEQLELPWEDGTNPRRPLSVRQRVLYSRYLSSFDWRPAPLRPLGRSRAAVDLGRQPVGPGQIPHGHDRRGGRGRPCPRTTWKAVPPSEHWRARPAPDRRRIPCVVAVGPDSLNRVVGHLQRDEFDILYLVCHGAMIRGEPRLYLEGADGNGPPATAGRRGRPGANW